MLDTIMSNGYVFWSIIAVVLVLCTICLQKGDFSRKWYTSWWGTFLNRHNFGVWTMLFLVAFGAAFGGAVIYNNKLTEPMPDSVRKALLIGNSILFGGFAISLILCYCRSCWGRMPLGRMLGWTIPISLLCGSFLLVTHPSIPDGAISSSLWSALKLNVNDETMAWFGNIGLYKFSTYTEIMRNSAYARIALWFWCGNCAIHILLCNGWMHCNKIVNRFLYPPLACLVAFLVLPTSVAVGFVVCAWAIFGAVIVVYVVAGLVVLGLTLAMISAWFSEHFGSSGRGRLSDGTKMRQICGAQWEDEHGNRWTNTGGNEFVRD